RSDHLLPQVASAVVGVDPETLDPAARLLDPELAGPEVAEQEAHHPAFDLRYLGGIRVAAQVVTHTPLPHVRPVDAGDPLVDLHDPVDVELVERPNAGLGLHLAHKILPGAGRTHRSRNRIAGPVAHGSGRESG